MKMLYKDETLYVDINERLNHKRIEKIQREIFKIKDDYDITNINLNVHNLNMNLDTFLEMYYSEKRNQI